MVMTGFLPTHSIETPMDTDKASGKAEVMRNRVVEAPHYDILWALMQASSTEMSRDTELINAVLPNPGTSGRDLLLSYPDIVRQLVQRRGANAFKNLNKDDLLRRLEAKAASHQAPRMVDDNGNQVYGLPGSAMTDLPRFVMWVRAVIERIFDAIFAPANDASKTIWLEAINFDVPTEDPLKALIVTETSEAVYTFNIPWYGRQVIQHDPVAFIMLAMIHIAKDIEE